MANRHLSRSIILQSLFEWDFTGKPEHLKDIIDRNTFEFAPGHNDQSFIYTIAELVQRKLTIIDDILSKAAPEWPLEKISNVDRNILRMGLTELLFGDREQVPPKVAINEAIELAKTFGGENSGKFVNGVLGAVYKEIGEPGKDQTSKPRTIKEKEPEEPIDPATLPVEAKSGGIVYAKHDGRIFVGLVHDVFGYWTMVKSGVDGNETPEETALRSVKEKLGLLGNITTKIGEIEYIASHPEKKKLRKLVTYFLIEVPYQAFDLRSNGGLDKADWFDPSVLVDLTIYDDILPLIAKAIEHITR